jgi:hypothetical protein
MWSRNARTVSAEISSSLSLVIERRVLLDKNRKNSLSASRYARIV